MSKPKPVDELKNKLHDIFIDQYGERVLRNTALASEREILSLFDSYLTQFTQELIEGLPVERKQDNVSGKSYHNGFNAAVRECTQSIKATLTKYTGGKDAYDEWQLRRFRSADRSQRLGLVTSERTNPINQNKEDVKNG